MKKIICIAFAALMLSAMPIHINAESAVQEEDLPRPETSADQISPVLQELPAETERATEESTEPVADPVVTDLPTDTDSEMFETEYVPVEDIEVSDFKTEMYVKETQSLYATVFPNTATNQTIRYSSSNNAVATVSTGGKITAVGKGTCRIYVSCAEVSRYYPLTVKVQTEEIEIAGKFIVIKPGEHFNLQAKAQPPEASQDLKFKSNNDSVVSVSSDGILTAEAIGNTSVIVSNDDTTILVNVIVSADQESVAVQESADPDPNVGIVQPDTLANEIAHTNEREITVKDMKLISSAVLKALYGTDKSLTVDLDEYTLSIRGQDIFNANNEIDTRLELTDTENGMLVKFNEGKNLPGTISIALKKAPKKYKYFYLVNVQGNEYQVLNSLSDNSFKVSSIGQYLLSNKNMNRTRISVVWLLGGFGVILLLSLIYIFTKKKYWFW